MTNATKALIMFVSKCNTHLTIWLSKPKFTSVKVFCLSTLLTFDTRGLEKKPSCFYSHNTISTHVDLRAKVNENEIFSKNADA